MARDQYERIQQRAYEIWENEGRPEGAAARHWDQALDGVRRAFGMVVEKTYYHDPAE